MSHRQAEVHLIVKMVSIKPGKVSEKELFCSRRLGHMENGKRARIFERALTVVTLHSNIDY